MTDLDPKLAQQRARTTARWFLIAVFLILRAGDGAIASFARNAANPWPALPGLIVGGLLASSALLIAIWRRSRWARFVLTGLLWVEIALFCVPGVLIAGGTAGASRRALVPLFIGVLAYVVSNLILITSRRIDRLGSPRGCAD